MTPGQAQGARRPAFAAVPQPDTWVMRREVLRTRLPSAAGSFALLSWGQRFPQTSLRDGLAALLARPAALLARIGGIGSGSAQSGRRCGLLRGRWRPPTLRRLGLRRPACWPSIAC